MIIFGSIPLYEPLAIFVIGSVIACWVHITRNYRSFIASPSTDAVTESNPAHLTFLVAGRNSSQLLQDTVDNIGEVCGKISYTNYEIKAVVDNLGTISLSNCETILVPKDYQCLSQYKARALHYSLGFTPNSKDSWILHLDEDALVTDQGVLSVLEYIKNGGEPVANGPSLFLPNGKNRVVSFLAEAQRHWTFYWLSSMLKGGVPCFLNGSNLLIRSDIEHQVGWSFEDCIYSEDTRFGYETKTKVGSVFGWHGGLTFEQQPANIRGIIKQRKRWFSGSIRYFKFVPKTRFNFLKIRRLYSISSWVSGAILAFLFIPRLFGFDSIPTPIWITIPLATTFGLWFARYYLGLYMNMKYANISNSDRAFYYLAGVMTPLAEIVCDVGVVSAIVNPPKKFEITGKVS